MFEHTKTTMTNERLMENLRNEIYKELKNNNMVRFAAGCEISYECLKGIVYKKTKSIDSKTLVKICENSEIKYVNIFEIPNNCK